MSTKRKLKKTNAFILMLAIIGLGLLSFFTIKHFYIRYPKNLLEKNIPQQENDITYKISKSIVNDHFFVFHYPDTNIDALDAWILDVKIDTLDKYQDAFDDEEVHQIKQEYDAYESGKQYLAIKLKTFVDDKHAQTVSKTYDKKAKAFVNTSLFNQKAKRFITHQLRENQSTKLNRKEFLKETHLTSDFENLYLKDNELTLYHPYKKLTLDLKEDNAFLKEDFLEIKKGLMDDVPSVYLDYGFDKEDKLIAISFDDGPYTKNTLAIMDILDKYEAKATFFLLGSRVKGQEDTVRALVDRGHQIASHSLSHPDFTRLSNKEIIAQLNATEEAIAKATHHQEKLFVRPPYGALRKDQMEKLDYVFVNWSVDTEDWRHRDAKRVCDISLKYAYDGSILLMHELYDSTVDSLDCILKTLDEQGYQFVTIKELFEAKELDYKHGHLYYDGI